MLLLGLFMTYVFPGAGTRLTSTPHWTFCAAWRSESRSRGIVWLFLMCNIIIIGLDSHQFVWLFLCSSTNCTLNYHFVPESSIENAETMWNCPWKKMIFYWKTGHIIWNWQLLEEAGCPAGVVNVVNGGGTFRLPHYILFHSTSTVLYNTVLFNSISLQIYVYVCLYLHL